MKVYRSKLTLTASGVDGAATASGTTNHIVNGMVSAVYIARGASATTGVVIQEKNESPPVPVLTVANAAAEDWYYPSDADSGLNIYVSDTLEVNVTGANNDDEIVVSILWCE